MPYNNRSKRVGCPVIGKGNWSLRLGGGGGLVREAARTRDVGVPNRRWQPRLCVVLWLQHVVDLQLTNILHTTYFTITLQSQSQLLLRCVMCKLMYNVTIMYNVEK